MLSGRDHPLKPIDMDAYYLGQCDFPGFTKPEGPEMLNKIKGKQAKHLRRVQATNFIGRAAIHIVDLFRGHDAA